MELTRRELLIGAAAGATVGSASRGHASTPRRGGVFRLCTLLDPTGFDPHLTVSFSTMIALSFTHSRLVRVKTGPSVKPGTYPIEGDLAESWTQPTDTTYVFKLRRGIRWHDRPPVNGRELTAEDVKYTYERFLTVKGNGLRGTLEHIERLDVLDPLTHKFTLKEPFAWFLDALASVSTWIMAREAVEKFGDLKRPEAVIGTGPWKLERHEPNRRLIFVRHPHYFLTGLPYADGVELTTDPDPSSRLASWIAGKYDFAPEYQQVVRRLDLEATKRRKPDVQTAEYVWFTGQIMACKLDQAPFTDVRVRRAMGRAMNWKEILEASPFSLGQGAPNLVVPAAAAEWVIPIDQLTPEGRQLYEPDVAAAKRLLAQAGLAGGFKVPVETTPGFGPDYMDTVQVTLRNLKDAGIETDLKLKEYGAFVSSTIYGKFDKIILGLRGAVTNPDTYIYQALMPGQPLNMAGVDDRRLSEMIVRQRRTFDVAKRREIVYDIQRHVAHHAYYLYGPSQKVVSAWEPYVKNWAPNNGIDYGGRLVAAWLDR